MDNKLRKIVKLILVAAIVFSTLPAIQSSKAADTCTIDFRKNSKVVFVCEKGYKLDVAPFVQDGTMYLPVRFFFERFGYEFTWDEKNKVATATSSFFDVSFQFFAGKKGITIGSKPFTAKNTIILKSNRLFISTDDLKPISVFIMETIDFVVSTDKATITIDKPKLRYLWNDFTRPILNGNGKSLTLSKVMTEPDTKVVIVQIWHTACAGCVNVLKLFERMWTKYQGKGLKVVSINTDGVGFEDSRDARIEDTGITYEICSDPEYLLKPDWYDPVFPNYYVLVPGDKFIRIFQEGWDVDANTNFEKTIDSLCTGN